MKITDAIDQCAAILANVDRVEKVFSRAETEDYVRKIAKKIASSSASFPSMNPELLERIDLKMFYEDDGVTVRSFDGHSDNPILLSPFRTTDKANPLKNIHRVMGIFQSADDADFSIGPLIDWSKNSIRRFLTSFVLQELIMTVSMLAIQSNMPNFEFPSSGMKGESDETYGTIDFGIDLDTNNLTIIIDREKEIFISSVESDVHDSITMASYALRDYFKKGESDWKEVVELFKNSQESVLVNLSEKGISQEVQNQWKLFLDDPFGFF